MFVWHILLSPLSVEVVWPSNTLTTDWREWLSQKCRLSPTWTNRGLHLAPTWQWIYRGKMATELTSFGWNWSRGIFYGWRHTRLDFYFYIQPDSVPQIGVTGAPGVGARRQAPCVRHPSHRSRSCPHRSYYATPMGPSPAGEPKRGRCIVVWVAVEGRCVGGPNPSHFKWPHKKVNIGFSEYYPKENIFGAKLLSRLYSLSWTELSETIGATFPLVYLIPCYSAHFCLLLHFFSVPV